MADTQPNAKPTAAQRRHIRYGEKLQQHVYDVPELRSDDLPAHLRNAPRWIDLTGQR